MSGSRQRKQGNLSKDQLDILLDSEAARPDTGETSIDDPVRQRAGELIARAAQPVTKKSKRHKASGRKRT